MSDESDPRLEDLLVDALDSRLDEVHTSLPGKIHTYDPATQTAEVKIQVKRVRQLEGGGTQAESYPVLVNVPVGWPRAGGAFVHLPMAAGDFVWVLFSEAAIGTWRATGQESHPGDLRRHSLAGAFALPCGYPTADPIPEAQASATDVVIGFAGGGEVRILPSGVVIGGAGTPDFVALAAKVLTELNDIRSKFDLHTHSVAGVTAGPATVATLVPTAPMGAATSVAATKLKGV